jgi:hypothetical protein
MHLYLRHTAEILTGKQQKLSGTPIHGTAALVSAAKMYSTLIAPVPTPQNVK